MKSRLKQERRGYFKKRWPTEGLVLRMITGDNVWPEVGQRSIEIQIQERERTLEDSKYAQDIKSLILEGTKIRTNHPQLQGLDRAARTEQVNIGGQWTSENVDYMCRLCGEELETMLRMFEKCQ